MLQINMSKTEMCVKDFAFDNLKLHSLVCILKSGSKKNSNSHLSELVSAAP